MVSNIGNDAIRRNSHMKVEKLGTPSKSSEKMSFGEVGSKFWTC